MRQEKPITEKEIEDLLHCISVFDKTESLEKKGEYFEIIQNDATDILNSYFKPKKIIENNVVFPYFYKTTTTIGVTITVYGKVYENYELYIIETTEENGDIHYAVDKGTIDINFFNLEYKSTEAEYTAAKQRAIKFINEE